MNDSKILLVQYNSNTVFSNKEASQEPIFFINKMKQILDKSIYLIKHLENTNDGNRLL